MFIKLHLSLQQRYPRTLPELLTAVAAPLTRQQPDDAPVLHNACAIQQVTHVEFRMLEQLGCELATLARLAWADTTATAATVSEQLPCSASSCRIPRCFR